MGTPNFECWCDPLCKELDDCCSDVDQVCAGMYIYISFMLLLPQPSIISMLHRI